MVKIIGNSWGIHRENGNLGKKYDDINDYDDYYDGYMMIMLRLCDDINDYDGYYDDYMMNTGYLSTKTWGSKWI